MTRLGHPVAKSRSAVTRFTPVCSAIARSRRRGRRPMFVTRATQHRSGAHPEGLADSTAGWWCRRRHDEAGQVGKYQRDDPSEHDHATIMPRLGEGPATGSVRPGSNYCGAERTAPAALDHYG
jgi:hypothetical protein